MKQAFTPLHCVFKILIATQCPSQHAAKSQTLSHILRAVKFAKIATLQILSSGRSLMCKSKRFVPKIEPSSIPALVAYWEDAFPSKTTSKLLPRRNNEIRWNNLPDMP